MSLVNSVRLVGHIGQDPEQREGANGPFTTFSIATQERKDGETAWHNCVAFKKTGEYVGSYVKKGDLMLIEGELSYRKKDNITYTSIICSRTLKLRGSQNEATDTDEPKW
jgi:single-strand DNA-binding protein